MELNMYINGNRRCVTFILASLRRKKYCIENLEKAFDESLSSLLHNKTCNFEIGGIEMSYDAASKQWNFDITGNTSNAEDQYLEDWLSLLITDLRIVAKEYMHVRVTIGDYIEIRAIKNGDDIDIKCFPLEALKIAAKYAFEPLPED